jgi:Ribosomal proteins 50S-L15, 50S-L18e, 60S-L27A
VPSAAVCVARVLCLVVGDLAWHLKSLAFYCCAGTGKPALFFEGGQTPFWKSLPKRGFKNRFRATYDNVTLLEVEAYVRMGKLDPTRPITMAHLYAAGLLDRKAHSRDGVLLLNMRPPPSKLSRLNAQLPQPLGPALSLPLRLEVCAWSLLSWWSLCPWQRQAIRIKPCATSCCRWFLPRVK